jgi:hypothetical protein
MLPLQAFRGLGVVERTQAANRVSEASGVGSAQEPRRRVRKMYQVLHVERFNMGLLTKESWRRSRSSEHRRESDFRRDPVAASPEHGRPMRSAIPNFSQTWRRQWREPPAAFGRRIRCRNRSVTQRSSRCWTASKSVQSTPSRTLRHSRNSSENSSG